MSFDLLKYRLKFFNLTIAGKFPWK